MRSAADHALLDWLASMPEDDLVRVLTVRQDACRPPRPRHLSALAARLVDSDAITATIRTLPAPAVQVLRAAAALRYPATRADLAALLGVEAGDPDLAAVLVLLAEHALMWEDADGHLQQPYAVPAGWRYPLGLGRPIAVMLQPLSFDRAKEVARLHGVSLAGGKQAVIDRIATRFADREWLVSLVDEGPPGLRAVLRPLIDGPPISHLSGARSYYTPRDAVADSPVRWAIERGLLCHVEWDVAEMPREVALALRGPRYHAPFTPVAPEVATVEMDQSIIDRDAAVTAGHLLDRAAALLDLAAGSPLATVKSGGVGPREIKRLCKVLNCDDDEIRVLLEVTFAADLVENSAGLRTTGVVRDWEAGDPAERYTALVRAWWSTERTALHPGDGARPAALTVPEHAEVGRAVRRALLRVLSALGDGVAVDPADGGLEAAVAWLCPIYPKRLIEPYLAAVVAEAGLLGIMARDAVSSLGLALTAETAAGIDTTGADAGDAATGGAATGGVGAGGVGAGGVGAGGVGGPRGVAAVARDLLTVTCQTALLGSDLSAIVTGPPSAELARVLDRLADRETRGSASVWRFAPATIRRALDAGFRASQIMSDLGSIASAGVPQPLEYLVKDVARRHGEVSVTEVVSVIRGTDEALLSEIVAHRRLAKLRLAVLAPTVLASGAPRDQTLAALRDAGYAPVPAGLDGVPTVGRAKAPAAGAPAASPPGSSTGSSTGSPTPQAGRSSPRSSAARSRTPADRRVLNVRAMARDVRAAPVPEPVSEHEVYEAIARHAGQLGPVDRHHLHYLITYGVPAKVVARRDDGTTIGLGLESGELDGGTLYAWCGSTQDHERVPLSAIVKIER